MSRRGGSGEPPYDTRQTIGNRQLMALLEIKKLTMRFGGLTAVCDLDLAVPNGSIYSVIGPNGAGKTTVFNAVTGVYEPTEGRIEFEGRQIRRPFRATIALLCIAVGLFTSIVALVASVDVNGLWRAVIKRNRPAVAASPTVDKKSESEMPAVESFSVADAAHDFWGYLTGHMAVEYRNVERDWAVVPWNASRPVIGTARSKSAARDFAALIDSAIAGERSLDSIPHSGNGWKLDPDRVTESAIGGDPPRLDQRRSCGNGLHSFRRWSLPARELYVVWNRARRTPDVIASSGIARTFQNIRLFTSMTVLENVQVGIDRGAGRRVRNLLILAAIVLVFGAGFVGVVEQHLSTEASPVVARILVGLVALAVLTLVVWRSGKSGVMKRSLVAKRSTGSGLSACSRRPARWPSRSLTAISGGWRLLGRWPLSRGCCCSMSRRRE